MVRILFNRFNRSKVKILGINHLADQSLFQQIADRSCNSAKGQAHGNAPLLHNFSKRNGRCDRSSANTGLIGKTILKIRSIHYYLCAVICHFQLPQVCSRLCCSRSNLGRISNFIYNNHIIHINHGNAGRNIREGNQTVCNCYNLICILGIYHCIGKNAAVAFASVGSHIAAFVTGGRSNEGNIKMYLA